MFRYSYLTLVFVSTLCLACDGCDPDDVVRGCRIFQASCLCGDGCATDYRYSTREECRAALKGRSQDACSLNPCANNGACIQTSSSYSKLKCRCEGTGYFGPQCQYPCPTSYSFAVKNFPFECIEI